MNDPAQFPGVLPCGCDNLRDCKHTSPSIEFGMDLSKCGPNSHFMNESVIVKTPTGYRVLGTVAECQKMSQAGLQEAFNKAPEFQELNRAEPIKFVPMVDALKEFNVKVNLERPASNTPHGMNRCYDCNRLTRNPHLCKSCEGRQKPDPNKTVPDPHNRIENTEVKVEMPQAPRFRK